MKVVQESVSRHRPLVGFDALEGQGHVGLSPCGPGGLLAEDGDRGLVASVGFGNSIGSQEHAVGVR